MVTLLWRRGTGLYPKFARIVLMKRGDVECCFLIVEQMTLDELTASLSELIKTAPEVSANRNFSFPSSIKKASCGVDIFGLVEDE